MWCRAWGEGVVSSVARSPAGDAIAFVRTARDFPMVISRLRPTVELVLGLQGLARSFIAHELDAMENAVLAKTANSSVVGMLNEFGHLAATWHPSAGNLLDLSLSLATVPCGPLYKTHIDPLHAVAAAADYWIVEHR